MIRSPIPAALIVPLFVVAALGSNVGGHRAVTSDATTAAASGGDTITVAAAFYPLEEVAGAVGGDEVDVVGLTPLGVGPHDLELTAEVGEQIAEADVIVYLGGGFQPSVEKAISELPESVVKIDVLDLVELLPVTPQLEGTEGEVDGEVLEGDIDPHVWVDPANMGIIAEALAEQLSEVVPDSAEAFASNAATYAAAMTTLGEEFATGLETCESRTIVTSHRAFEYLAQRFDLKQVSIAGISPDAEPSAQTLAAVAATAAADGVTVVFFEEQLPADLSETVAREIGATTDVLDPIETITEEDLDAGTTYSTIQQANLASLVAGLRCT